MSDYFSIDDGREFLEHHGVKGQKWGVKTKQYVPKGRNVAGVSSKEARKLLGVSGKKGYGSGAVKHALKQITASRKGKKKSGAGIVKKNYHSSSRNSDKRNKKLAATNAAYKAILARRLEQRSTNQHNIT